MQLHNNGYKGCGGMGGGPNFCISLFLYFFIWVEIRLHAKFQLPVLFRSAPPPHTQGHHYGPDFYGKHMGMENNCMHAKYLVIEQCNANIETTI